MTHNVAASASALSFQFPLLCSSVVVSSTTDATGISCVVGYSLSDMASSLSCASRNSWFISCSLVLRFSLSTYSLPIRDSNSHLSYILSMLLSSSPVHFICFSDRVRRFYLLLWLWVICIDNFLLMFDNPTKILRNLPFVVLPLLFSKNGFTVWIKRKL